MPPILFWDVDTQRDFMVPTGKLYVPGAEEIAGNLRTLTALARERGFRIVASVEDHRLEDPEIALKNPDFRKTFPPHCLHGTPGQSKIPETKPLHPLPIENRFYPAGEIEERVVHHEGEVIIHKQQFDVFTNPNADRILAALAPRHVIVYGLPQDLCDRYAIEGLRARGRQVHFVFDAARPIHAEDGASLLKEWEASGVGTTTTAQLAAGHYLGRLE